MTFRTTLMTSKLPKQVKYGNWGVKSSSITRFPFQTIESRLPINHTTPIAS